jgi:hypothetical protein
MGAKQDAEKLEKPACSMRHNSTPGLDRFYKLLRSGGDTAII